MARWICARTHPNNEKLAIRNLIQQGFIYYQPKLLEKKKQKRGYGLVESPLFPCYLFIQVENSWRSLQYTFGIASVISMGSAPAIIQDDIIESLRKREQNGYIQLPQPKKFVIGDKVIIKSGPFEMQQALVQRMDYKQRQKVLLALLSNKIQVLIDESQLEAA